LEGIEALCIRAEDLAAEPAQRKSFDFITSRALTDLTSFIRQALPLLASTGAIIALKGKVDHTEVASMGSNVRAKCNNCLPDQRAYSLAVETYVLPFSQSERSIFTIRRMN